MIHTTPRHAFVKRTLRPLYEFTQSTPKQVFLDPEWDRSVPIFPGMALVRNGDETVTLYSGTGVIHGLIGNFVGGFGIDELLSSDLNATSCFVLDRDAEYEVLAPAFDTSATWTVPTDGTEQLVGAVGSGANRGKLTPVTDPAKAVARLLGVKSSKKIVIGGLR